jgi:hypothetical protein
MEYRMAVIQKDVLQNQPEEECNAFYHEVCPLLRITKTDHLHLYEYLRTDRVPSVESNTMHLLLPGYALLSFGWVEIRLKLPTLHDGLFVISLRI